MSPIAIAFWLFAGLTAVFAIALLVQLLKRPAAPKPEIDANVKALNNVVAQGAVDDTVKAMADGVSTILKALGEFGTKLETFGPAAMLGVFTIIFALFTVACAWKS
jgi:hypothetical protein